MLWWTDELKTGIEVIDNQHKSIFDKANDIFRLGTQSKMEEIEEVFKFLMSYTVNHFYEEEMAMIEHSYVDFIEHRNEHNYFIEQLYIVYKKSQEESFNKDFLLDLKVLVIEWLADHINIQDKKFIKEMKKTMEELY